MLSAGGPQAGQHGDNRAVIWFDGVDSVLRADPRAPLAHAPRMATGRYVVKHWMSVRSDGPRQTAQSTLRPAPGCRAGESRSQRDSLAGAPAREGRDPLPRAPLGS